MQLKLKKINIATKAKRSLFLPSNQRTNALSSVTIEIKHEGSWKRTT